MSKARIRHVRAERDGLATQLEATALALRDERARLVEIKDLVGWFDPVRDDPKTFRDDLWRAITDE